MEYDQKYITSDRNSLVGTLALLAAINAPSTNISNTDPVFNFEHDYSMRNDVVLFSQPQTMLSNPIVTIKNFINPLFAELKSFFEYSQFISKALPIDSVIDKRIDEALARPSDGEAFTFLIEA